MTPTNRVSCEELVKKLQAIHDKCFESIEYCTERKQQIPEHRTTALSELIHSLSPKLDKGLFKKHKKSPSLLEGVAINNVVSSKTRGSSSARQIEEEGSAVQMQPPTESHETGDPKFNANAGTIKQSYDKSNALRIFGSTGEGTTRSTNLEVPGKQATPSELSDVNTSINSNEKAEIKANNPSDYNAGNSAPAIGDSRSRVGCLSCFPLSCFPTKRRP